jgi:hypothetical protein
MARSDHTGVDGDEPERPPAGPSGWVPGMWPQRPEPTVQVESWDPVDDETSPPGRHKAQWSWHGQPSWGRRAVAAFPTVAVVLAVAIFVLATTAASGQVQQVQSIAGTGGATLLVGTPPGEGGSTALGTGGPTDYNDVVFNTPSVATRPIQASNSLALPGYGGWEANGSAGPANGLASVSGGLLNVAVRHATPGFAGWFLTATSPRPASCVYQFTAASPPPVTVSTPGATGELVMAVQTGSTIVTGDINYVFVAELVPANGQRSLVAGYSLGHLSHATEHLVKQAPWAPGPMQVAIQTNGDNRLSVWINGTSFLQADHLHMGITPPLEPYLEVQAERTPYTVAYSRYSTVCQSGVVISGLPDGTVATLGHLSATAHDGTAVFPADKWSPPVTGVLALDRPGTTVPVRFASRTYWPGDRLSFQPGK